MSRYVVILYVQDKCIFYFILGVPFQSLLDAPPANWDCPPPGLVGEADQDLVPEPPDEGENDGEIDYENGGENDGEIDYENGGKIDGEIDYKNGGENDGEIDN